MTETPIVSIDIVPTVEPTQPTTTDDAIAAVDNESTKPASPIVESEINPTTDDVTTPAVANGGAKKPAPVVEPINPREDPVGYLKSLRKHSVHMVTYQLLKWMNELLDEDKRQPIPGDRIESTTKNQFVAYLKDGVQLARIAKKFDPTTTIDEEPIKSDDKEAMDKQAATNIEAFIKFLKDKLSLNDDQVFSVADLQEKGKSAFDTIIGALLAFGTKAHDLDADVSDIDVDRLLALAKTNWLQYWIGAAVLMFKLPRQNGRSNSIAAKETTAPADANGKTKDDEEAIVTKTDDEDKQSPIVVESIKIDEQANAVAVH